MKVLGRVRFDDSNQRQLVAGGVVEVDRARFRQYARGLARVGDLLWVQEPFWVVCNTKGPNRAALVVVAPFGPLPTMPRHIDVRTCERTRSDAKYLSRANSRATLEIMGVMPDSAGVRCIVHMQQVDEFLKSQRAAA